MGAMMPSEDADAQIARIQRLIDDAIVAERRFRHKHALLRRMEWLTDLKILRSASPPVPREPRP